MNEDVKKFVERMNEIGESVQNQKPNHQAQPQQAQKQELQQPALVQLSPKDSTDSSEPRLLVEHAQKFYDIFNPYNCYSLKYTTNDFNTFYVKDFQKFVELLQANNNPELLRCCYACVNEVRGDRRIDNVISVDKIFVDIDTGNSADVNELLKKFFELGFNVDYFVRSGRGFYAYLLVPKIVMTLDNRSFVCGVIASVIDYFHSMFDFVDVRCKDISRICRVWGTINYKNVIESNGQPLQSFLIHENSHDEALKRQNWDLATKIFNDQKHKYPLFSDSTVAECYACDAILNNTASIDYNKQNTGFNDSIGKNLAIYAYRKYGDNGLDLVENIYANKKHATAQAKGWMKKARADKDFKVNCYEVQYYLKEHGPDVCACCERCMRERKNRVVYTDEQLSHNVLKEKYRQKLKFFISKKGKFDGTVLPSEQGDTKKLFCVGTIYKKKKPDNYEAPEVDLSIEDLQTDKSLSFSFLDDPKLSSSDTVIRQEWAGFYRYDFKEKDVIYKLFSERKIPFGEALIEGMDLTINDKCLIGETLKLNAASQLLFCYDFKPKVQTIKSTEELFRTCNGMSKEAFMSNFLSKKEFGKNYVLTQPKFITTLLLSWLFSGKDDYPLHLNIIGPPHSGKTEILQCLNKVFNEHITDCGGSTFKSLIPSFHGTKPELGSLLKARRICMLDELVNMIARAGKVFEEGTDIFTTTNNIVEHKLDHNFSSGKGEINATMRAKIVSVSNPAVRKTVDETIAMMPESFIDRFLHVRFTKKHSLFVTNDSGKQLMTHKSVDKFSLLSIYDFMQSFISNFDKARIDELFNKYKPLMPEVLSSIVEKRFKSHHLPLVLDGIIKTRCLFSHDENFSATSNDYLELDDWLRDYVRWWWDDEEISKDKVLNLLSDEHRAILSLVDDEISRVTLVKRLEERNIEVHYNLLFLYDNDLLKYDGHNMIKKLVDTTKTELNLNDLDLK